MLEYFAYKRYKKNKAEKEVAKQAKGKEIAEAEATTPQGSTAVISAPKPEDVPKDHGIPVLDDEDERFLESLTTYSRENDEEGDGPSPPLPPRVKTPDLTWDSDSESFLKSDRKRDKAQEKPKEKEAKNPIAKQANRLSLSSPG